MKIFKVFFNPTKLFFLKRLSKLHKTELKRNFRNRQKCHKDQIKANLKIQQMDK